MTNKNFDALPAVAARRPAGSGSGASFPVVGVGASAGGLEAFTQLLQALPLDTGMGFVLVQHLDPEHESALTQILSRATSLPVSQIVEGQAVLPNQVFVIPRDTNLRIEQGVLKLEPRQRGRTPHRPIDSFFESLAQDQHERAIGVVLSGTASDGTLGLESIKAEGGITFAQDDSAKYDSMPRSAVAAGCVDLVLAPADIGKELARIAKHPYAIGPSPEAPLPGDDRGERDRSEATAHEDDGTPLPSGGSAHAEPGSKPTGRRGKGAGLAEAAEDGRGAENEYKRILLLLRNHSGVDFSLYKSTTIQRRINRRVVLTRHNTLADYSGFVRGNDKELDALYSDVLISVTSFFRNPEMFEALQRTVLPALLKQPGDGPLRCWVLGCSTGQEAYSLAMAFVEAAEKAPKLRTLQIFATDLNDALLTKARNGLYAKSLVDDLSPERLRRFFVEEEGGYRVTKALREMVVFARQNFIADPPFSRMDIISCRNLLIYLEPTLQKKALPTFHYALKPKGFLLLGVSESIGAFTDLFETVDKKYKIYAKKPALTPPFHLPLTREHGARDAHGHRLPPPGQVAAQEAPDGPRGELSAQREADRIALAQYAPPGVVINSELQVLQFRGPTGAYLEPPAGKASFDVLKMAREGLMLPLRATINEAMKENRATRKEGVRIQREGQSYAVDLEVTPLKNLQERCFLILFEDADGRRRDGARIARQVDKTASRPQSKEEEAGRIASLESDLAETREYLKSTQEQHEAANEELQAANEEVQSANEELRSVNEELETSKEELESANEELTTVNEEMANRNVELNRINNDLVNLQTAIRLAVVLLGRDLSIRRFSPQAEKQLDLLATDVGRPISHIRHGLVHAPQAPSEGTEVSAPSSAGFPINLEDLASQTISEVQEHECEVQDRGGRWHSLRVRPYVTVDGKVDGAVLLLVDIDAIKRSEQEAAAARDYAESTISTVRESLLTLDSEMRVESANLSFYRTFRSAPQETVNRSLYSIGDGEFDIPRLRELLEDVKQHDRTIEDFEIQHEFESLGMKIMLLNARRVVDMHRNAQRILLAIEDITERKQAEQALRESEERFRTLADNMSQFAWAADANGSIYWYNQRWYDYTGTTPEKMQDSGWQAVHHPDHVARVIQGLQHSWDTGEPWEDTFPLRAKDGQYRWFLSRAQPIRDREGNVVRWFGTDTDVTERREMEDQIKQQAQELADESRRKDEFLAMLSHELRNPLAPIRSAVHLLRVHERDGENSIQQQAREIIERQVANLTKLVSDLLEVSRVVSGRLRLNLQPVDLNQVVEHAIETVSPLIEQHQHELVLHLCPGHLWVNADATRVEEVFINLLENAAKYTPDGGRIEVQCEQKHDETVAIRVRDNGTGIDKGLLPRIFDLFTQADRSLARSQGGLGIGLSLAHRLVELHGGTIEAHSPPEGLDVGSEFIVRLRLSSERPQWKPEAKAAQATDDPSGTRVLVVDDNLDQLVLVTLILRNKGYSVQSSSTGPEGLRLAQQWRPDIVLLDIGLPELDGYEVARRLRSDAIKAHTGAGMKLIALTGYGRETDIAQASEAGFDAHLVKPFDFDELERLMAAKTAQGGPR